MKCYTHADVDAAGICRSCGKGLCMDCARDIGFGIVCSDACEELAKTHHEMMERAAKMYRIGGAKQKIPLASAFFAMFGVLLAALAAIDWTGGNPPWINAAMSGFFILFGALNYVRARRIGLNI